MGVKDFTITQKQLKERFHYNPETGHFTWIKTGRGCLHLGAVAGGTRLATCGKSYIKISFNHTEYFAHRLIWLYIYGVWPDQIDHVDGDGCNNKLENLREATGRENSRNKRLNPLNKSGVNGVCWNKVAKKWQVYIKNNNGKAVHLGYFEDVKDAAVARKAANEKYGYHPNHGSARPL